MLIVLHFPIELQYAILQSDFIREWYTKFKLLIDKFFFKLYSTSTDLDRKVVNSSIWGFHFRFLLG